MQPLVNKARMKLLFCTALALLAVVASARNPFCQYHHSCTAEQERWLDLFNVGWNVLPGIHVASDPPENVPNQGLCRSCYWNGYSPFLPTNAYGNMEIRQKYFSYDFTYGICLETTRGSQTDFFIKLGTPVDLSGEPSLEVQQKYGIYCEGSRDWREQTVPPDMDMGTEWFGAKRLTKWTNYHRYVKFLKSGEISSGVPNHEYNNCNPDPNHQDDQFTNNFVTVDPYHDPYHTEGGLQTVWPIMREDACKDPCGGCGSVKCAGFIAGYMGLKKTALFQPVQQFQALDYNSRPWNPVVQPNGNQGYSPQITSRTLFFHYPASGKGGYLANSCRNRDSGSGQADANMQYDRAELYCQPSSDCTGSDSNGICATYGNDKYLRYAGPGVLRGGNSFVKGPIAFDGQVLCNSSWTGPLCIHEMDPTTFDARSATECPDPAKFDICSGRGHCQVKPGGVGLRCSCAYGWYGDERYINMFTSRFFCPAASQTASGNSWTDTDGEIARYAANHQCTFWRGRSWYGLANDTNFFGTDPAPPNWDMETVAPSSAEAAAPGPPFKCSDHRTVTPNNAFITSYLDKWRTLYGGLHCTQCPDCSPTGSVGCFTQVDRTDIQGAVCYCSSNANDPDSDCPANRCDLASADPMSTSFGTNVKNVCRCKRGYFGERCEQQFVPISTAQSLRPEGACDFDKGHSQEIPSVASTPADVLASVADFTAVPNSFEDTAVWGSSFPNRCRCKDGWGGAAGTCEEPVCTQTSCAGGACTAVSMSSCPTYPDVEYAGETPGQCRDLAKGDCQYLNEILCGPGVVAANKACDSRQYTTKVVNKTVLSMCDPPSTCTCMGNNAAFPDDTTGCNKKLCLDNVDTVECSNKVVAAGWAADRVGDSVCDYTEALRQCDCYMSVPKGTAPKSGAAAVGVAYKPSPNVPQCGRTWASVCLGLNTAVCSNNGVVPGGGCYPSSNCGPGDSFNDCVSLTALRTARPTCECADGFTGPVCAESACNPERLNSAVNPCSAGNTGGVSTGTCKRTQGDTPTWKKVNGAWEKIPSKPPLKYECECEITGGQAYTGQFCERALPTCTTPPAVLASFGNAATNSGTKFDKNRRLDLCSGAGICQTDPNSPNFDTCECDPGHTGAQCQTRTCAVPCEPHQGHCVENPTGNFFCQCHEVWGGSACDTDLCAASAGVVESPNECNCNGTNGSMYPAPDGSSPVPRADFVGCRKLCSTPQSGELSGRECGGLDEFGKNRCSTIESANDTSAVVVCSCLNRATNPITGQATVGSQQGVDWVSVAGGWCEPRCYACEELINGQCNPESCDWYKGPCQFTGPRCNESRCGEDGTWNGSACVCDPAWLYDPATNPTCDPSGPTRCVVDSPWREAPTRTDGVLDSTCSCSGAYSVDRDTTSPTYRLCVSACPVDFIPNPITGDSPACVCKPGAQGTTCQVTTCDNGQLYNDTTQTCDCSGYSQWGGLTCGTDLCVHGTARPVPEQGCECFPVFHGDLCQFDSCGFHGTPVLPATAASTCVCDPGWSGDTCERNLCLAPTIPFSDASTPRGYRCECGPAGRFDETVGVCVDTNCSSHGTIASLKTGEGLQCICDKGFSGVNCETTPCPPPLQFVRDADTFYCTSGPCEHSTGQNCPTGVVSCNEFLANAKVTQARPDNVAEIAKLLGDNVGDPIWVQYPTGSDHVKLVNLERTTDNGTTYGICGCSDPRYSPVWAAPRFPANDTLVSNTVFSFGCWVRCGYSGPNEHELNVEISKGGYVPDDPEFEPQAFIRYLDPDTCQCNETLLSLRHTTTSNYDNQCGPDTPSGPLGPVAPPPTPTKPNNATINITNNNTISPGGLPPSNGSVPYKPPDRRPTDNNGTHPAPPAPNTTRANQSSKDGHPLSPPAPSGPTVNPSSSKISTAAWAGIGIGAVVVAMVIGGGIYLDLRRMSPSK